ncbi:adenosylmethionine--8-amino-7-oxononanoate transaminase [Roseivirga misakiensis]|uniref:Adenosylmethionine-8-amino-7-oxononanoate aminotransferase n=1 Tax=Roseivirga misakiensis TaxID=1563681 RepID=A0A1E5SKS4_9BACT|nr:adenosylmethionine--8-amino-7-oxononanoate transaminase [Roseivirga misakiensis]OEJ99728.1 adenosylmethionine--8-amino-7-oxononanoate transaminase [Roseivirga misakiensis]
MTDWIKRDELAIWHPFTPLRGMEKPLMVERAEGVNLYTDDGKTIIDAISSWWVNIHGHSHPHLAQAIATQASRLEHVIFAGFTHEPAIRLAERLLQILPENQAKIFYSDNGSTAVEVAMKMAFQFFHNQGVEKRKIIAIDGAYHGDTFGAMSVGERGPFTSPFDPYLFEVDFVDFPNGENDEQVWQHFQEIIATNDVAAFIYEPIAQGASGMRVYDKKLLDRMISLAQAEGVICIADEVMTGFGRTGELFAADALETNPDIMCLSKGLTGGALAMGVTTCTQKIQDAYQSSDLMKTFFHGHSFTANPITCAVANASLDLLLTDECTANRARLNDRHTTFGKKIAEHPLVRNTRVLGTIIAFELNTDRDTSYFNEARHHLYPYFIEKGILIRPLGNVIYLIPPYIISNNELDFIYQTIFNFLEEYPTLIKNNAL